MAWEEEERGNTDSLILFFQQADTMVTTSVWFWVRCIPIVTMPFIEFIIIKIFLMHIVVEKKEPYCEVETERNWTRLLVYIVIRTLRQSISMCQTNGRWNPMNISKQEIDLTDVSRSLRSRTDRLTLIRSCTVVGKLNSAILLYFICNTAIHFSTVKFWCHIQSRKQPVRNPIAMTCRQFSTLPAVRVRIPRHRSCISLQRISFKKRSYLSP